MCLSEEKKSVYVRKKAEKKKPSQQELSVGDHQGENCPLHLLNAFSDFINKRQFKIQSQVLVSRVQLNYLNASCNNILDTIL